MSQHHRRCDVAVIGGGAIGSSVAYFLKQLAPHLSVVVIEPDPTYEFASTLRSSGGCRVQFTCRENIEMSLFGIDFIRDFAQHMSVPGAPAEIDWVQGGYLFIVPPEQMSGLETAVRAQQALGCVINLLSRVELKQRFPSINASDLGGGAHSPQDGWCDPNGLLWGFRRKAVHLGAIYLKDRVAGADLSATAVRHLVLESGDQVSAAAVVNSAGAWSGDVARLMGMQLPVTPLRRFEHYFTPGSPVERLPYVKDVHRLAFRSEGVGFSGGLVNSDEPRGYNFEVDHAYFEETVWPAVAHRFPAFEAARCHRTWSGLYEQCELDGNAIIGRWNNGRSNLYTVAGFSGHGTMHAPAAGRAISELIVHGEYKTIDLARFGYERVEQNAPYREAGIL